MRLTLKFLFNVILNHFVVSASKWSSVPETNQEIWMETNKHISSRIEASEICRQSQGNLWCLWHRNVIIYITKNLKISEGKLYLITIKYYAIC